MTIKNSKNKKGIASITIVLLLGFLSVLVVTSIFTYNVWRWENLENGIKKEKITNAIDGISLMQYTWLMRYPGIYNSERTFFDSYENAQNGIITNTILNDPSLIEEGCSSLGLPPDERVFWGDKISTNIQSSNFFTTKECCIASWNNQDRVGAEESINNYSTIRCKNMNWPNLKDTDEALMVTKIIQ